MAGFILRYLGSSKFKCVIQRLPGFTCSPCQSQNMCNTFRNSTALCIVYTPAGLAAYNNTQRCLVIDEPIRTARTPRFYPYTQVRQPNGVCQTIAHDDTLCHYNTHTRHRTAQ